MKPRARLATAATLLAASGLVFSGCTPPPDIPPSQGDPTTIGAAPQSVLSPSQDAEGPTIAERIEQATRLAAGYDFAAATKALAGAEGAEAESARADIKAAEAKTEVWEDNSRISHLFVHSLIVDPQRALDGD